MTGMRSQVRSLFAPRKTPMAFFYWVVSPVGLERCLHTAEVTGSSPVRPTKSEQRNLPAFFICTYHTKSLPLPFQNKTSKSTKTDMMQHNIVPPDLAKKLFAESGHFQQRVSLPNLGVRYCVASYLFWLICSFYFGTAKVGI